MYFVQLGCTLLLSHEKVLLSHEHGSGLVYTHAAHRGFTAKIYLRTRPSLQEWAGPEPFTGALGCAGIALFSEDWGVHSDLGYARNTWGSLGSSHVAGSDLYARFGHCFPETEDNLFWSCSLGTLLPSEIRFTYTRLLPAFVSQQLTHLLIPVP